MNTFGTIAVSALTSSLCTGVLVATFVELQPTSPGTAQAGNLNLTGTVVSGKLRAGTSVAGGALVRGEDTGAVGGGYFRSKGNGVYGGNTATTGLGIGGSFASTSTGGRGVYGESTATTGSTRGGMFIASSPTGAGVYSLNKATTGESSAITAETKSNSGIAIKGIAPFGTKTVGVLGSSAASSGYGVQGSATGTYASGVYGEGYYGVYGLSHTSIGVQGIFNGTYQNQPQSGVDGFCRVYGGKATGVHGDAYAETGQVAYGIYGTSYGPGTQWGLYTNTNLGVVGTKSFEIDHPLDPENKTLRHYCAEGDKPLLVYTGEAKLDANGHALVTLPNFVAPIIKDVRYQLTAVGKSMPGLCISRRFSNGTFEISGGVALESVSWEMTGTRNDLYVKTHGAPTEVQKTGSMAGKYLSPELYGAAASKGVFLRNRD